MMEDRIDALERIAAARRAAEAADADEQVEQQRAGDHDQQPEDAADRRLRTADALLAEARALKGRDDGDAVPEKLREAITEMYMGDADKAAAAMAEAVRPDPKALAAEVRRELDVQDGLERFKRDFPEIVADVHLARLADAYFAQAVAGGKSTGEAFAAAGQQTRAHLRHALGVTEAGQEAGAEASDSPANASDLIAAMTRERIGSVGRQR